MARLVRVVGRKRKKSVMTLVLVAVGAFLVWKFKDKIMPFVKGIFHHKTDTATTTTATK